MIINQRLADMHFRGEDPVGRRIRLINDGNIPGAPKFYPAEKYHQDYMTLHPTQPYIAVHDLPKVAALKTYFPERYRADPVLVSKTGI